VLPHIKHTFSAPVGLDKPGGNELGELRFEGGAVGAGVGEGFAHFSPSISKRIISASCFAVGNRPFNSPGSFDCKV
jgi:hypothetical protein